MACRAVLLLLFVGLLGCVPAVPPPPALRQPPPERAWRMDGVWWCYYEKGVMKWCETDDPRAVPRLSY